MLTYTIEYIGSRHSKAQTTLFVEGKADFRQLEKLRKIILDALAASEHLVLNFEMCEEVDHSLNEILYSIRGIAKQLGKKVTVRGGGGGARARLH